MNLDQWSLKSFCRENRPITFIEKDILRVHYPHNNPLVITVQLKNMKVCRTLVDNESSGNILYQCALERRGLKVHDLKPISTALYGFTGDNIQPLGSIQLTLTIEDFPKMRTIMTKFLVINYAFVFNALLGHSSLGNCKL